MSAQKPAWVLALGIIGAVMECHLQKPAGVSHYCDQDDHRGCHYLHPCHAPHHYQIIKIIKTLDLTLLTRVDVPGCGMPIPPQPRPGLQHRRRRHCHCTSRLALGAQELGRWKI